MDQGAVIKLITLITFTLILPAISTDAPSSAPPTSSPTKPHTRYVFKSLLNLMCARYSPAATTESIESDEAIQSMCDSKDNPTKCREFMGNTKKADPAFAIKADTHVIRSVLREGSFLAARNHVPELKESFESCAMHFDKAVKDLDDAAMACEEDKTKVHSMMAAVVIHLRHCHKALEGTPDIKKKYTIKDLNDDALDAARKVVTVSKKLVE